RQRSQQRPEDVGKDSLDLRSPVALGQACDWSVEFENDRAIGKIASRRKIGDSVQYDWAAGGEACGFVIGIESPTSDFAARRQPAQAVGQLVADSGEIVEG